jgi:ketosteroid isomerase-like protein
MKKLFEACRRAAGLALVLAAAVRARGRAPLVAPPGMPRTQKHESRHEIDQLEEAWRNAVLKGNTAAMDSLLADDYMAITPSAPCKPRSRRWKTCAAARMHFTTLDISDRKVRFYGTTALVTSVAEVQGHNRRARSPAAIPLYPRLCAECPGRVEDCEL